MPRNTSLQVPAPSIALIDDDQNILTSVQIALKAEGFEVRAYTEGAVALAELQAKPADLAVLDVKMPRMDGLELLKRLRATSGMPVIFLTSKDEEDDELEGLSCGADDYIRKPFSQSLLIARIKAALRRRETDAAAGGTELIARGHLALDPKRHLCAWKGQPIDLTVTEFLILKALAQRPGHVKSRDQLLDVAYGEGGFVDDRTIDSHIKRLRKKFKQIDANFTGIETLYGIGYRFAAAS